MRNNNKGYEMKVLLTNGTVGEVANAEIGEIVIVTLQDENGNKIKITGKVEEIF